MQPADYEVAVTPGSMDRHATTVGAVATEVEIARVAATQVRLDSGAYGMVCAFVPVFLNGLSDGLMTGLSAAATSLQNTSDRLKAVALKLADANAEARGLVTGTDE